jgi:transposase
MRSIIIILLFLIKFSICPKMDELRTSLTSEDQKSFIKCHVLLGDSAADVYKMIVKFARSKALSRSLVYSLYQQFEGGERTNVIRKPGSGRPKSMTTNLNKERLRELLLEDNDMTIDEMAQNLNLSYSTVQRLLDDLNAKYVASQWLPHDLKTEQKQARIDMCQHNLELYRSTPDLLDRIIAIDESWLRSYDPKDPKSAKKWCLPEQHP